MFSVFILIKGICIMEKNRILALENGEKLYKGKPCRACNGRIRNAKFGYCVACSRRKGVEAYRKSQELIKSITSKTIE